jgi:glycosyltransferase involved in cell wall biosynthesis
MKILYLDHTSEMGGAEHNLVDLLTHLDRTRLTLHVATTPGGPLVDHCQALTVPVSFLDFSAEARFTSREQIQAAPWSLLLKLLPELLSVRQQLRQIMREQRIDLLQTNSLKAHLLGSLAVWGTSTPVLWHLQDLVTQRGNARNLLDLCARLVQPRVVCITEAVRRDLSPNVQKLAQVIYNGIDPNRFRGQLPNRAQLGIPEDRFLIGLVGHLIPWKGHRYLLEAAAQLRVHYPHLHYLFVGGEILQFQGQAQILRQEVARLGLTDCVTFGGIRKDIPDVMASLDLLVLPSENEPFGRVLIEAMAAGKPVLATAGGGVPEIVVHEETGLLVPVGDVDALAAGIRRFVEEPELVKRCGEEGQARVARHFTLTQMAKAFNACYEES